LLLFKTFIAKKYVAKTNCGNGDMTSERCCIKSETFKHVLRKKITDGKAPIANTREFWGTYQDH